VPLHASGITRPVQVAVEPQTARSQHTSYARNYTKHLCRTSLRWASNARNMQRHWLLINELRRVYEDGVDSLMQHDARSTEHQGWCLLTDMAISEDMWSRKKAQTFYTTKLCNAHRAHVKCQKKCDTRNNRGNGNHLKIFHNTSEQHTLKLWRQEATAIDHISHCVRVLRWLCT
jgi:hypothetical protein